MQSDRYSFCGDVVLNSVDMAFRDDDSILDQIYEMKICSDFYYDDFILYNNIRKCTDCIYIFSYTLYFCTFLARWWQKCDFCGKSVIAAGEELTQRVFARELKLRPLFIHSSIHPLFNSLLIYSFIHYFIHYFIISLFH